MSLQFMPWQLRVTRAPMGRNTPYFEVVAEDEDGTRYPVPGLTMVGSSWSIIAAHIVIAHNFWLQEGGDAQCADGDGTST